MNIYIYMHTYTYIAYIYIYVYRYIQIYIYIHTKYWWVRTCGLWDKTDLGTSPISCVHCLNSLMSWDFMFCYSNGWWTPISCVQSVAYSVKNHGNHRHVKTWCRYPITWLIEPHEIGVWHLQRAKTILYRWERKSTKTSTLRQLLSHRYWVYIIYIYIYIYWYIIYILVGGPNPSEEYWSDWITIPNLFGENKHVPNHQPYIYIYIYTSWLFNIAMENHHV